MRPEQCEKERERREREEREREMGRVAAVPAGNAHVDASKRSFRRVNALQTHTHTHIHSLAHTHTHMTWLIAYGLWH